MITLKQARDSGKMDQFIAEHKGEKGDPKAFNQTLKAMAQKSPKAQKASSRRNPDD